MKEPKTTETDDTKKKLDTSIIFKNNQMELMDENITDNWEPMNKNFFKYHIRWKTFRRK